jgi:hypothetical protein
MARRPVKNGFVNSHILSPEMVGSEWLAARTAQRTRTLHPLDRRLDGPQHLTGRHEEDIDFDIIWTQSIKPIGNPLRLPRDTLLPAEVGTNFGDKWRPSFGILGVQTKSHGVIMVEFLLGCFHGGINYRYAVTSYHVALLTRHKVREDLRENIPGDSVLRPYIVSFYGEADRQ